MSGHKVVTVERGERYDDLGRYAGTGYAARCADCDAVTFGGFSSRSEAREALAYHEALT